MHRDFRAAVWQEPASCWWPEQCPSLSTCAAACHHWPRVRGVLPACWPCTGIQALHDIESTSTNRKQFVQSKSSLFYSFETFHRPVQVKNWKTVQEKVAGVGGRKILNPLSLSVRVVQLSTQITNQYCWLWQTFPVYPTFWSSWKHWWNFLANLQTKVVIYTVHSCNILIVLCNSLSKLVRINYKVFLRSVQSPKQTLPV